MTVFTFIICWRTCDPRSAAITDNHECTFNECIKCGHRVAATVKMIEETSKKGSIPIGICYQCAISDEMRVIFRNVPIEKDDHMSAADMAAFVATMKAGPGEPGIN